MYAAEGFCGFLIIIFIINDTVFLTSATQKLLNKLIIFTAQPTLSANLPQF